MGHWDERAGSGPGTALWRGGLTGEGSWRKGRATAQGVQSSEMPYPTLPFFSQMLHSPAQLPIHQPTSTVTAPRPSSALQIKSAASGESCSRGGLTDQDHDVHV